jgi:hypothetical protein
MIDIATNPLSLPSVSLEERSHLLTRSLFTLLPILNETNHEPTTELFKVCQDLKSCL